MELSINLKELKKLLCKAKDIDETDHGEANFMEKQSPGVQYLFRHFLRPIIYENAYSIEDIDMEQFDRDELETIWEIYRDRYSPQSDTWRNAEKIYAVCSGAPSQTRTVTFI